MGIIMLKKCEYFTFDFIICVYLAVNSNVGRAVMAHSNIL